MNNFAEACKLSFAEWEATMPNFDEIPQPEYSKKHIKRINKLFDQMRGDTYHHFTRKTVRIMLIAAVLIALLLSAFVFPSSRELLMENFDIFGVYKMSEHNNNSVNGSIEIGYIPDGYELIVQNNLDKSAVYIYQSQNGDEIKISKNSSATKVEINTENGYSEDIIINNIKYTYIKNYTGVNNIIWIQNDYIYQVCGNISKEELLKIAQSIK